MITERKNLKVPEDVKDAIRKVAKKNDRSIVGQLRQDYITNQL